MHLPGTYMWKVYVSEFISSFIFTGDWVFGVCCNTVSIFYRTTTKFVLNLWHQQLVWKFTTQDQILIWLKRQEKKKSQQQHSSVTKIFLPAFEQATRILSDPSHVLFSELMNSGRRNQVPSVSITVVNIICSTVN